MSKLTDIRRIIPEDFKPEEQDLVSKIAGSYNDFADELFSVVNGQLDFDNMARRKVTVDVTVNALGNPISSLKINTGLTFVSMITIGKVDNLSNTSTRLTQAPYLDWTHEGAGLVRINYVLNLVAGNKYRFTLELVQ